MSCRKNFYGISTMYYPIRFEAVFSSEFICLLAKIVAVVSYSVVYVKRFNVSICFLQWMKWKRNSPLGDGAGGMSVCMTTNRIRYSTFNEYWKLVTYNSYHVCDARTDIDKFYSAVYNRNVKHFFKKRIKYIHESWHTVNQKSIRSSIQKKSRLFLKKALKKELNFDLLQNRMKYSEYIQSQFSTYHHRWLFSIPYHKSWRKKIQFHVEFFSLVLKSVICDFLCKGDRILFQIYFGLTIILCPEEND